MREIVHLVKHRTSYITWMPWLNETFIWLTTALLFCPTLLFPLGVLSVRCKLTVKFQFSFSPHVFPQSSHRSMCKITVFSCFSPLWDVSPGEFYCSGITRCWWVCKVITDRGGNVIKIWFWLILIVHISRKSGCSPALYFRSNSSLGGESMTR